MTVNVLIFVAGLAIYAGYGLAGLGYLACAVLISYGAALLTRRFPWTMYVSVVLNAAVLVLIKLQPVTGMEITAAMGVSYFGLQLISYNVDVWRGKYEPEQNLLRYGLYITYLPHLFFGPIERYDTMKRALFEQRRITWDGIFAGGARLLWGLCKKLVIAARAGVIIAAISAEPEKYQGGYAFAAMVLYSVQLYSDFSGGIDMVLGVSRMLGIRMSENFNAPFFSESFQEFWRRWHITLGSWLREYVYIPLGGNRKGKVRKVLNTIVTFLVSGLWHGVHYLLWGLINGIFVCCGERFKTKCKTLNRAGMFLLVSMLWCFFIWPDTLTALQMVGSVFTVHNWPEILSGIAAMGLTTGDWIVLGVAVAALWLYDWKAPAVSARFEKSTPAAKTAVICILALLVLVFGMYGLGFEAGDFIYSQF